MTERMFKYVPYHLIEEYYGQCWFISSLLGPPHCHYAVLMEREPMDENMWFDKARNEWVTDPFAAWTE